MKREKNGLLNSNALDIKGFNMVELGNFGEQEIYTFLNETKRIMRKKKWFIFCSEKQIPYYTRWALDNKLKFNILVWCKPNGVTDRRRYSTNIEYIVRIYSNGCSLNKIDFKLFPDKIAYYSKWKVNKRVSGKNKLHPSQKPISILKEIIELNTTSEDVILDSYMGSGSTGVAVLETRGCRKFIGIEKEDKYFEIAKERIENAYNKLNCISN